MVNFVTVLIGGITLSGNLIRLFLVDGNPNGLRTLEISNMTIYTTVFPRIKLKDFLRRKESEKPGCYILLGNNLEEPDQLSAYVGEGESVETRLRSHAKGDRQKDFWNQAIVFTSKDDYITKTQIQYLEAEIYSLMKHANKVSLENNQIPTSPNLSEVDTAEMKQFLNAIRLIMASVGIDILEPERIDSKSSVEKEEIIYEYKIHDAFGQMKIDDDKYIVLRGSTAVAENRPSASKGIIRIRESLIKSGVLKKVFDKNLYEFTDNFAFSSPSYAASSISGGTENGRRQWKHEGKSLREIEQQEIDD